jgi:hypothetical protein
VIFGFLGSTFFVARIRKQESLLEIHRARCQARFMLRRVVQCLFLAMVAAVSANEEKPLALRDGDIVFSGSDAGQGGAIIAATRSPYTHCGIVFISEGKWMVLEAVQPVGVVSLEVFKSRAKPGTFKVSRLKTPLSPASYQLAKAWAEAQVGKNYDSKFLWNDSNMYCSELVWKVYERAGVRLCEPRRFRDYHLDDSKVKEVIIERYGASENLPKDENVVAPSDIAGSILLADVFVN